VNGILSFELHLSRANLQDCNGYFSIETTAQSEADYHNHHPGLVHLYATMSQQKRLSALESTLTNRSHKNEGNTFCSLDANSANDRAFVLG